MGAMKVRDSGMPEQNYWETLFDVPGVLDRLGVDDAIGSAIEVGCGYGTFTIPVAQRISGTLHSFDIEPDMIELTRRRATAAGVTNLHLYHRDVIVDGFGLPEGSMDAVLLFNILHAENPEQWLRLSAQALRPNGLVLAIHWRSDIATPRGPDLAIRPRPEQIVAWAQSTQLLEPIGAPQLLLPWHYGITLRKTGPN